MTIEDWGTSYLTPGNVAIVPAKEEEYVGLIALPDKAQKMNTWGVVINSGDCAYVNDGDTVIFDRWAACHFDSEDKRVVCVVNKKNILVVVSKDGNN